MTTPRTPPGTNRLLFGTVTAAVGLLLSLATLELGARAIDAWRARQPRATEARLDLLQPNPHGTGSYRLKPNLDILTRIGRRTVHLRTNSHGMPWREVEIASRDGRQRVAFLGDSFTFGCWADSYETSFVGVFEKGISPARWEVLNFGVGGYGFADAELLLREEVVRFSPRYVVVVSFNGNDFRDTFLGVDKERLVQGTAELDEAVLRSRVPAEQLVEDPTASQPCALDPGPRRWLEWSAAFRLAAPLLRLENLCIEFAVNRRFTLYTFWSQFPYPAVARKAKDVSLETLDRMERLAAEHDARLALVALPTAQQVYARQVSGPDYDIGLPQAYLEIFARERDLPYLDLLPPLRERVARTNERLFVERDTHLNNLGHEVVGELIADWFRCCVKGRPRR